MHVNDTTRCTANGLMVGDRVIDFRGETLGTVEAIEVDRGGRSDKVTVMTDHGYRQWNYCSVWSLLPRATDGPVF